MVNTIALPPVVAEPTLAHNRYVTALVTSPAEVAEAQALRFEVFNVELAEGLVSSFITGCEEDPFDAVCQHLLVRETATGKVVGTYRFQTGPNALEQLGYYSEMESDLAPLEPHWPEVLEPGRACVHQQHRNLRVLARCGVASRRSRTTPGHAT